MYKSLFNGHKSCNITKKKKNGEKIKKKIIWTHDIELEMFQMHIHMSEM